MALASGTGAGRRVFACQASIMNDLRNLFTERDFLTLTSKVRLVLDDARIVAEDDDGGKYGYRDEGFPDGVLKPGASEWFRVYPRPD